MLYAKIYIKSIITISILTTICIQFTYAQDKCNYPSVNALVSYKDSILKQPENQLVDIKLFVPDVKLDIKYATIYNFLHKKLYPTSDCYCNIEASKSLRKVQDSLKKMGLGLVIFDAYRPYKYTCQMWTLIHDERYVADPQLGSGHNRGIAVDVSLVNFTTKKEIAMPTAFDNFSDTAFHSFQQLPKQTIENRRLLREIMAYFGFKSLETEWWHYQFIMPNKPPVYNIECKQLKKLKKLKLTQ